MISKPGRKSLSILRTISISLTLWVAIIILLPLLTVYKKIIELILKSKHGELYGGFMDEADTLYLMPNGSMDCLISAVLIIRSDKKRDIYNELRRIVQDKVLDQPDSYIKLTSSKQSFGGYPYLFKYDCDIEDIIKVIDVPKGKRFDEDYIKEVTADLAKKELPKNNSVLWNIHVGCAPLQGDENETSTDYRYPVIFRMHHCIGGGASLIAFFIQVFGDGSFRKYSEELTQKIRGDRSPERKFMSDVISRKLKAIVNILKFWFEFIFLALGRTIEINYMKPSDINALHGKQCGEKIAVWATEKKPEYVPLVKDIKKRISKCTFTSVVCTALAASLTNYFIKNKLPVPEHIQVLMTMLLEPPSFDPDKPVPLKNATTGLIFELPLKTNNSKNLTDFLRKVSTNLQEQTRYADLIINRFFVGYAMGLIPLTLIPNTSFQSQTILLSNIPGGPQIKVLGGCPVEFFIPFAPNFHEIGVSIAILTYDDRFQISLLADKALLQSQSEAQKIVDDVFANISLLDTVSQ